MHRKKIVAVEVKALFCRPNSRNMSNLEKIRRKGTLSARESMARSLRCGRHQGRHRRSSSSLCRLPANACRAHKLLCRGAAASFTARNMAPVPSKLWETRNSPDTWCRFARPSLPEPLPVYDYRRKRPMTRTASQRDGMAIDAEVEIG